MKWRRCDNCDNCIYDSKGDFYWCEEKKKVVELDDEACEQYEPYKDCRN